MTREQVIDVFHAARTLDEIATAWHVRSAWLAKHPDDMEVIDYGEMLSMIESGYAWEAEQSAKAEPAVAGR